MAPIESASIRRLGLNQLGPPRRIDYNQPAFAPWPPHFVLDYVLAGVG